MPFGSVYVCLRFHGLPLLAITPHPFQNKLLVVIICNFSGSSLLKTLEAKIKFCFYFSSFR